MAWTQSDLDAVESAIASGEMTVRVNDRLITYRSIDELLKARDVMRATLAPQVTAGPTSRMYPRRQIASFADD